MSTRRLHAITASDLQSFHDRARKTRLRVLRWRLGSPFATFVALLVSRTLSFLLSDATNEALTLHWFPSVSESRTMQQARFLPCTGLLLVVLETRASTASPNHG